MFLEANIPAYLKPFQTSAGHKDPRTEKDILHKLRGGHEDAHFQCRSAEKVGFIYKFELVDIILIINIIFIEE
jgi:hypothetical protein